MKLNSVKLHSLSGTGLFTAGGTSFSDDARNPSSGSFSASSENNTEYSPLATAISRVTAEDVSSSAIATDFYVESIAATEEGLKINFLVGDEKVEISMNREEDCAGPDGDVECSKDGTFLSSWTDSDPRELGSGEEFEHMDIHNLGSSGYRLFYLFGINPEKLPTGTASYLGRFRADAYKMTNADNSERVRYNGQLFLSANFDMSKLEGRIHSIRGSQPGQSSSSDRVLWPTSSFTITDGRIVNGQFTAVLTGHDSNPEADFNQSVRGYMGHILGEFFGPNSEEVGAVISASRDVDGADHDYVLYGFVGGSQFGPVKVLGSEGISVGVNRNFEENKTELLEQGEVTIMRNASDSGWVLTTDARTVEFEDSDYRSEEGNYFLASAEDDAEDGDYFWTATNGFSATPDYDYFDIKGWANNHDNPGIWVNSFIIHGDRTPISSLPSSTATYYGRMHGREFPSDDAISWISEARRYQGDLTLTADFANTSVMGEITNLETRVGNSGSYRVIQGDARFNASITGHNFTANDFSGTGDISNLQNGNVYGSFFGPTAQEAGGIFDADLGSDVVVGYFGAAQEQ
ncbi:MAG: transferrin-binding protein-like solute binding protein [Gammaproteobacteria bacterium]|nr:transferrin-binding protein-like solute binding protein [Gammaproteobacteria bacterium]